MATTSRPAVVREMAPNRPLKPSGCHVSVGSKAVLTAAKRVFCYTPESRLNADIAPCPKGAPKGDSCAAINRSLLDHLVGARKRLRNCTMKCWPMSVGSKASSGNERSMSALPPTTDIYVDGVLGQLCATSSHVPLLDHLVGKREQRGRNCDTKGPCRFK